ncbi:hypothetical protein K1719_003443 [Acacia pycnantha]|nr:hypothetical protein K1719_003443 [Acacia pycnantha]
MELRRKEDQKSDQDFDKDRSEECFKPKQIWALYDEEDGMPRLYCIIHEVISTNPFKIHISYLSSKTDSWSRCRVRIYPRIGDIWAVYQNWSPDWNRGTPDEVRHPYEMVEVLDEYSEEFGKLRKVNVVNKLEDLRDRISSKGVVAAVQKLVMLLKSLKDLERQENHFLSCRDAKHSEIQAEISELEGKIENGRDSKILLGLHHSFSESLGKLDSAKKHIGI